MGDWNSSGPASWRKILWLDVGVSQVPTWIGSVMLVASQRSFYSLLGIDLLSVQLWVAAGQFQLWVGGEVSISFVTVGSSRKRNGALCKGWRRGLQRELAEDQLRL